MNTRLLVYHFICFLFWSFAGATLGWLAVDLVLSLQGRTVVDPSRLLFRNVLCSSLVALLVSSAALFILRKRQ